MLEGWASFEWSIAQQEYYKLIGSLKSGKRWMIALIKKLWLIAWDMWEHRNGILHEKENTQVMTQERHLNNKVAKLYSDAIQFLSLSEDSYMLSIPISQLLQKPILYIKTWLETAQTVILRHKEWQGSAVRSLLWMRKALKIWLTTHR